MKKQDKGDIIQLSSISTSICYSCQSLPDKRTYYADETETTVAAHECQR